jgi:hypothetical protein
MASRRRSTTVVWVWVFVWSLATALACASEGFDPVVETGGDAEITADGLHRLRHAGFEDGWLRPDANLAAYDTIVVSPPLVAYDRTPRRNVTEVGMTPNFLLSQDQMASLKLQLVEAIGSEFARSAHYAVVETPGPGTLRIDPAIVRLVVRVPTDPAPDRDFVYSTATAILTLVLDVRDAETGEILARFADRREARAPGSNGTTTLTWSNPVNDSAAVRITFRRWARVLREKLDRLQEMAVADEGRRAGTP